MLKWLKAKFSDPHYQLCSLLKDERLRRGMTQAQLAKVLDTPQSFVSKYESGERRLDFVEAWQVVQSLELDFAQFAKKFSQRNKAVRVKKKKDEV